MQEKAERFRKLAELDAVSAADRLSWDDTAEGERLRRYELTCDRTWFRTFDLLLKTRQKGGSSNSRPSQQSTAPLRPTILTLLITRRQPLPAS